ncbi:MAG: triose-phosphate isomerase [Gemmatimonadota bacterium]|jgi:triosephosphate isomerase|nr:triose-phosphate isomerase [Gemmatimonadota bacterium]
MLRAPVIAGNWKLNHGPSATTEFFESLIPRLPEEIRGTVAVFPPSVSLSAAKRALAGAGIRLGVQNLYWEPSGAFTGEISPALAMDAGATLALVGHSERRHLFGETDREAARKAWAAIEAGLTVVFCVGETLEERDAGRAFEVVERQFEALVGEDGPPSPEALAVAYEPVWAIGTGRTASPADATDMHRHIHSLLSRHYGAGNAGLVPILYGGSVKPENAAELLAAPGVDGLLIGGASLDPVSFAAICGMA